MNDYSDILTDIRKIVRSVNLESKRIQKDFGISIPQLLCLSHLSQCEEFQSTHKDLTRILHLNSSTVTGIVNRLEKKGLIARLPKKDDKRVTNIALTSAGYEMLEKTPDLLHQKLLARITALPEEQVHSIKAALQLIITALGVENLDASPMLTIEDNITRDAT
ncbi:MAG: MarR family transcriptional regulator [Flavobacteriales bacterium]|nr:MarR family transcriptional regulator [Flavobacteriales bacterium]